MLVPALFTQTSMPPKAEVAALASWRTWAGIGDVGRHGVRSSAERLAVLYGPLEQFAAPAGEDHVGTASGKSLGGR